MSSFAPDQYLYAVERYRATTLNLVPTMVTMLLASELAEKTDFSSVRSVIYGASPMPRDTLTRAMALWGPRFVQYYGQTECPLVLTALDAQDHLVGPGEEGRLLSCGAAAPMVELEIRNESGNPLPPGEVGEIVVRSPQQMVGYWKATELTAKTIVDGWVYTRDMGYLDDRGYLTLVDRKSDMIISGGFNIYPREVEDALCEHPAVFEAAVVGVPDDIWGEAVTAFVVLESGQNASEAELIDWVKNKLGSYKKPKYVRFINEIPKTAVGKPFRRILRDSYWKGRERTI